MSIPAGYRIIGRTEADDVALAALETRAGKLFAPYHPQVANQPPSDAGSVRALFAGRDVWVAADGSGPAGFIVAAPLGPYFHIFELSVDPSHGRRGLGSALVACVEHEAAKRGLEGISLTTFRDVPFNAPFYAGLGFVEADGPLLAERRRLETPQGCDPASRVAMLKRL
ncbi:MAG: GNAT family N-acetyltransferase [Mesorhizobium sp.]